MKAKETQKRKFVYPDKLYARTNDNITLDISYAPQTVEAVEYVRTDAFINKATEWQRKELCNYFDAPREDIERFIEDFKKAMML